MAKEGVTSSSESGDSVVKGASRETWTQTPEKEKSQIDWSNNVGVARPALSPHGL